ncbi:MAG: DUF4442 domain-containing protein [Saprospiraceae bacterium]|nr:DUF4442 domain-containing protein [Saprospiraceae bacterium]MCB0575703.1 DUF4442 domain-containing protein [Saprospiraceae bacterium]MCB9354693.1 DUF4442 domain-containing protein [Lewinellaceae bacterium]
MTRSTFLRFANSSWRMRFFLFWKLPAAWFMGISVRSCDGREAVVALPYRWRSQNPFRSTYFAAQCAAAELSTGLLALTALQERPPVSMLVVKIEAEFIKKASGTLLFTCNDGDALENAIQKALETGEPQVFTALSTGRLPDGAEAARVRISWSFKAKGDGVK